MKKIILSVLLTLALLLSFAACDTNGKDDKKKDDPEKNVDYLVSALNEGIDLEEIKTEAEGIDVNELLTKIKEASCELELSGTVEGETGNAYLGFKDMVLYIASGAEGEDPSEQYVFIEDDWTMVSVSAWDGEYSGSVDTGLKEIIDSLSALEGEETTAAPADDAVSSDAMSLIAGLLEVVASAELPEATVEDVKYEDGKYYLAEDYIEDVLNKYIDVVFEELGKMEMLEQSDLLDAKAAVKGYLDYISLEVYCYIECEEITGIGVAVSLDETFAAEKLGYSDVEVALELCNDRVAIDLLIANGDDVLADVNASIEYEINKDNELESLKVDVDAKICTFDYEWDEESYEYVETAKIVELAVDIDADFVDMSKGKGEFLTCKVSYTDGENGLEITANADSSEKGKKISCDLSIAMSEDGETETSTLAITANLKSADNMPKVPQGAIDARDDAIEDYNNGTDWWY